MSEEPRNVGIKARPKTEMVRRFGLYSEELRNVGIKTGILKREENGVCIISDDFNKFYDKYQNPKTEMMRRFGLYMDNKKIQHNINALNKMTIINITKLTIGFVVEEWVNKKNISLTIDEFNIVVNILVKLTE